MSEKNGGLELKIMRAGVALTDEEAKEALRQLGIGIGFEQIKSLLEDSSSTQNPDKRLELMNKAIQRLIEDSGRKDLKFSLQFDGKGNVLMNLDGMDKALSRIDDKVKSLEQEKITKESFGRFYRSSSIEYWDIPDGMSVDYNGYSSSSKGVSGRNIGISAKKAVNSTSGEHVFKEKKLITLEGNKKAFVVVGEGKEGLQIKDSYKDISQFKDDISSKSDGVEVWAGEIDGSKMTISEIGDPEVHRLIQTKIVDRGTSQDPLVMEKNNEGNYSLGLFGGESTFPIDKEKIKSLFSQTDKGLIPNMFAQQDIGEAPKSMKDDETYFVSADEFAFGDKAYDVVFQIKKVGERLVAVPTPKISLYEDVDLGFGSKFNLNKYLKTSNFENISKLDEKNEQSLDINEYYGWGELKVDLKFDNSKKNVQSINIRTVGKTITLKDFGNLEISSFDQKGFESFYDEVWNIVNSSLYNAVLVKNGGFLSGDGVKSSDKGLELSCDSLNKVYADKKLKSGKLFKKELEAFLIKSRDIYISESEFAGYESSRQLLAMGLVSKEQLRRTYKKNYDYPEADLSNITYSGLGDIAAAFESGGNIGLVSVGHGDAGGVSYGKYQLSSRMGSVDAFLNFCSSSDAQIYGRLHPLRGDMFSSQGRFAQERRTIAEEEKGQGKNGKFYQLQEKFFQMEFFAKPFNNPALKSDVRECINKSNKLKEAFFSSCIQHGYRGIQIFNKCVVPGANDKDNLDRIYEEREKIVFGANLSANIKQSIVNNRYPKEKKVIMEKVN